MTFEVDDGQHARFGLEAQHALVGGLVLPRARTDQSGASEIHTFVAVDVARHEDVRYLPDDQTVLRFWR